MKSAIIIPAYNEVKTVSNVIRDVLEFGVPIVIDDGSDDGTGDLAQSAGAIVVRHSVNLGYDAALESGFSKAASLGVNLVVTFDADGQHDPKILKNVFQLLSNEDNKMVIGIRSQSARFSERLFNKYINFRFGVPDILCGLKGYNIELYKKHGSLGTVRSIGTKLALSSLRNKTKFVTIHVPIYGRLDKSRLGSLSLANWYIFRAFLLAIKDDLVFIPRSLSLSIK